MSILADMDKRLTEIESGIAQDYGAEMPEYAPADACKRFNAFTANEFIMRVCEIVSLLRPWRAIWEPAVAMATAITALYSKPAPDASWTRRMVAQIIANVHHGIPWTVAQARAQMNWLRAQQWKQPMIEAASEKPGADGDIVRGWLKRNPWFTAALPTMACEVDDVFEQVLAALWARETESQAARKRGVARGKAARAAALARAKLERPKVADTL